MIGKRLLRAIFWTLAAFLLRVERLISVGVTSERVGSKQIVVVAADRHGCFGDEALLLGTQNRASSIGLETKVLVPGAPDPWRNVGIAPVASDTTLSRFGRTSWNPKKMRAFLGDGGCVVLGNDIMDGAYGAREVVSRVGLLNLAVRLKIPAMLVNLSFREEPSSGAVKVLRAIDPEVSVFARDPLSRERLQRCLHREVGLSPDVGCFMAVKRSPIIADGPCESKSDASRPIRCGVVVNAHFATLFEDSEDEVAQVFSRICYVLQEAGFEVSLIAHDLRESVGDLRLLQRVQSLTDGLGTPVIPGSASAAKETISSLDVLVSGRMHAALAALSSGVPCLGIDYLNKFHGQFSWFGVASWTSSWATVRENPDEIPRRVAAIWAESRSTEFSSRVDGLLETVPQWLEVLNLAVNR